MTTESARLDPSSDAKEQEHEQPPHETREPRDEGRDDEETQGLGGDPVESERPDEEEPQDANEDDVDSYDDDDDFDGESLSDKANDAADFLEDLLEKMDLDVEIDRIFEDERIEIELYGADAGRVIGKKGQTLDALQFIVNKVVNRFPEDRKHVLLDVEGYKERRDDSLRDMARRLAQKVTRTGKTITVNPMPSRERRVIHLALADVSGVTTRSDGQGTDRRVRIIPDSPQRRRTR